MTLETHRMHPEATALNRTTGVRRRRRRRVIEAAAATIAAFPLQKVGP